MFGDSKFDESEDFMNMFSSKKDKLPPDYHLFASAAKVWIPPTNDKLIRKEYEIYYVEHTHEFFKTIKRLIEIDKVPIINIYTLYKEIITKFLTLSDISDSDKSAINFKITRQCTLYNVEFDSNWADYELIIQEEINIITDLLLNLLLKYSYIFFNLFVEVIIKKFKSIFDLKPEYSEINDQIKFNLVNYVEKHNDFYIYSKNVKNLEIIINCTLDIIIKERK